MEKKFGLIGSTLSHSFSKSYFDEKFFREGLRDYHYDLYPLNSVDELKKLLDTTDGNLSVHGRKLEEAGYVMVTKSFEGRVPRTEYRLAPAGRRALDRYLSHMEALIQAMRDK